MEIKQLQEKLQKKFDKYFLGLYKFKEEYTFVFDDKDSKFFAPEETKEKIQKFIDEEIKDEKIKTKSMFLLEIWQMCNDGKYDILAEVAMSEILHDTNDLLNAIKLTEVHKQMTLQKFEKYIVAYVPVGAIFRGDANPNSDIDAFIVIDDTDVKRMTRMELRDKLMAIIYQMAAVATQQTGVKRKLHIQTYLLTDFWDTLKDSASPVIFSFLRDGIPFFDRGIYMPWKQLLGMGKIKPSPEAIKMFNDSGAQFFDRAKKKVTESCVEDCYYAILNPAQSALMMSGVAPTTPRETVKEFREMFVEKEKLIEPEFADILQKGVENWKSYEYGILKTYEPKDVPKLFTNVEKFLKRLEQLFADINKYQEKESVIEIYDRTINYIKLLFDGNLPKEPLNEIKERYVKTGEISEGELKKIKQIFDAKAKHEEGKLKSAIVQKIRKDFTQLEKLFIEKIHRQKNAALDTIKFRVKIGDEIKNVALLDTIYLFENGRIIKYVEDKQVEVTESQIEEALTSVKRLPLNNKTLKELEKIFGKGVEIFF